MRWCFWLPAPDRTVNIILLEVISTASLPKSGAGPSTAWQCNNRCQDQVDLMAHFSIAKVWRWLGRWRLWLLAPNRHASCPAI